MSLSQQALSGFAWTTLERFGGQGIQFITVIILARMLSPEDFGLVAMLIIFVAVSNTLIDCGFSQALIREDQICEEDKSTTFYINLITACIIYALLWFGAPAIAIFFDQPELTSLTRFMGTTLIFYSLTIVQRAVYLHALDFKLQAYVNLSASIMTGIGALTLAFMGYGVWALAAKYVLMAMFTSLFYWINNPWVMRGFIHRRSLNKLFGFGSKLMASGLLDTAFRNVYDIIIGKFFTVATLGFYMQAVTFKDMTSKNIISSLQKVTYPILAKTKNKPEKLKDGCRKIIQITSFFLFPAVIGLAFVAKPLILTLIGEQWVPVVPILQLLCLSALFYHLHAINLNLLKVMGRSDLFLKLEVIKKVIITFSIIIGIQFGFWGLLIGQVISSYVALLINMHYTTIFIKYTIKEQLYDIIPILFLSLPMIVVLSVLQWFPVGQSFLQLLVMLISGVFCYSLTNLVLKAEPMLIIGRLLQPRFEFLRKFSL
ncbi:MAG: lipopolysaccharide biosynthesis protein [Balneolales bacterium]